MIKSLVTGGAGFIGSHLVEALLQQGHHVRVLDDFSTGKHENLRAVANRVEIFTGSVTDPGALAVAAAGRHLIFHLAAIPSVQRSVQDPDATHAACCTGTLRVLEAARAAGVRRVMYAASSSAYGDTPGSVRREDDALSPVSPYAVAKLGGELYCRCFTQVYGLETVRLRFFNIFGPRQDPRSPYSGVIALFTEALLCGRTPTIFGDGLQSRDFTYVANAVQAMVKASQAPAASGNVYNVGTAGSVSVVDLLAHLNDVLGTHIKPMFANARPGDVRDSQADISRSRCDLGYDPDVSFLEGLRRTVEWCQSSRTHSTAARPTASPHPASVSS